MSEGRKEPIGESPGSKPPPPPAPPPAPPPVAASPVHGGEWIEYEGLRRCRYCGSLTVEDATRMLSTPGVEFSGSDWKYGFPHKFYLDAPTAEVMAALLGPELAAAVVEWQRADEKRIRERFAGSSRYVGKLHAKFYTEHLRDATPEQLAAFDRVARPAVGVEFFRDERGTGYRAPRDRQWFGVVGPDGQPDHGKMDQLMPGWR